MGDEIFKKSSPLKLLSQSQPNFAEMIQLSSHLGQRVGPPDTILEKDHPMTILSKFGSN
jgi:hypothetical protein